MRTRNLVLRLGGVIAALALSLSMATAVLATSTMDITGVTVFDSSCTSGFNVVGSFFNDDPTVDLHFTFTNVTQNTTVTDSILNYAPPLATGLMSVLPGSPGDVFKVTMAWKNDAQQVLATDTVTFMCDTGEIIVEDGGGCDDGRVNENCAAPAAVYCDGDSTNVFSVDADGNGTLAFSFDPSDYTASDGGPVLVGSGNGIEVWYLPESGQFQVHAYQADGKLYTLLWTSCAAGVDAEYAEYEQ